MTDVSVTLGDPRYVAVLLTAALALTVVARVKSGSWSAPWYGHRPLIWLLLATAVPPVAVVLLVAHRFAKRPITTTATGAPTQHP